MAGSEDHVLRTSPSRASHKPKYTLKCTTQPLEPPSPPPNSPLPALPSHSPYHLQKSVTLGPPPRPPRPQTSLPNLKPRVIKSPERPSRPFNPLVVEQIKNAPAQPSCLSLSSATETVDKRIAAEDNFASIEVVHSETSQLSAGATSYRDLYRITQSSQTPFQMICMSPLLGLPTERVGNFATQSSLKPMPSTDSTAKALIRSPLHIPSHLRPPSLQSPGPSSSQTAHQDIRDLVCSSITLESPITDVDVSSLFAFKLGDRCSEELDIKPATAGEAITCLPPIQGYNSDFKFQHENDFFSVAYSSTKDNPGPPPAVISSSSRTSDAHASSIGKVAEEKDYRGKSTVQQDNASSRCFSKTYIYGDSSYSSSARSRDVSFNAISSPNSTTANSEERHALSWCARHKNRLWVLATVLLVLIATVGITGGIVAKLSLWGTNEKVKRANS